MTEEASKAQVTPSKPKATKRAGSGISVARWKEAQKSEKEWWGNCVNTWEEEWKQVLYSQKMRLRYWELGYNIGGHSILDVGGGPASMLLKCHNFKRAKVIDPCQYPDWVYARYEAVGIEYEIVAAEDMKEEGWTDVWMYNVLQHVIDPKLVVKNARKAAEKVRFFDWIEHPVSDLHPHRLTAEDLNKWFDREGQTEVLNGEHSCNGLSYYGVFPSPK